LEASGVSCLRGRGKGKRELEWGKEGAEEKTFEKE